MIRFGNEYAVSVWRRHQTRHSYAEGPTCAVEAVLPRLGPCAGGTRKRELSPNGLLCGGHLPKIKAAGITMFVYISSADNPEDILLLKAAQ